MDWLLSAFTDEAGEASDEQIAACRRGGLKHIDPRNIDGHNITALPLDIAEMVATRLDDAGVRVNMYGSPIGKLDIADDFKTDTDRLEHLGKLKGIFGASGVRIFSYYNKAGVDKAKWKRQSIDRLKRLRDLAGKLGLVLFHENESGIYGDHPEQVADIAELRDGETFKLIYDFGNYLGTGVPSMDIWRMFQDRTDCFHFKDRQQDGQHVPIGRGDTQAEAILRDAHARGWSGPCVVEPHLTHSKVVLATGAHGTGNRSLASLSPADSFQVAVEAAQDMIASICAKK